MPARTRLFLSIALGVSLVALAAPPSAAAATTTLTVGSATTSGSDLTITGTLAVGDDATGPITIADDSSGDSTVSGVGLDIKKLAIATDLAGSRLVYRIETYDMPPVVDASAPFYGYTVPFLVDAKDPDPGYFLGAGFAGSSFPPATGKWYNLCTATGGSYECPTPLSGTMAANLITITLPFTRPGQSPIKRGSIIDPSGNVGCGGVCSTIWAGFLFNNAGGDSAVAAPFKVPGEVTVGIAPAATPIDDVETSTKATVAANGGWTASLSRPSESGDHVIVARSCWGNQEEPICTTGSTTITL